jgi:hypothetical protein
MSLYRVTVPPLDRVTPAIGYVCVYWAWLENTIGELILDLSRFDTAKILEREKEQIRDIILTDADIRSKIKILRAIAFVRKWEDSWFAQLDKILNHIDNDLRPKRNRVVHAQWGAPKKRRLQQFVKRPSLKRPRAFAKLELSTREQIPVKMREVWHLSRSIIAAMIKLTRLMMRYDALQKEIDKHIEEEVQKQLQEQILKGLTPEILLGLLLAKSSEPNPHPLSPDNRPKNSGSKRPRRPRSA